MMYAQRLFLIFVWLPLLASAQNESDSVHYQAGIYAGYYFPASAPAHYYNATDNNRLNEFLNRPQIRPQIEEALGNREFSLADTARDMRYQNQFSLELMFGIKLGQHWWLNARLHNVRLTASGVFTLNVTDPQNPTGPTDNLEQAEIYGRESRSHLNFGLAREVDFGQNFYSQLEAGLDLCFTEVKQNQVMIGNREFSLPMYQDRLNPQATPTTQIGAGYYLAAQVGYQVPGGYGIWLKLQFSQAGVNLNQVTSARVPVLITSVGFQRSF